jgi:hypothetical protein
MVFSRSLSMLDQILRINVVHFKIQYFKIFESVPWSAFFLFNGLPIPCSDERAVCIAYGCSVVLVLSTSCAVVCFFVLDAVTLAPSYRS